MYIIPFHLITDEAQTGAKGGRLAAMKRAGFPVPDGFVISLESYNLFFKEKSPPDRIFMEALNGELDRINAKAYMVRSSAIGEDSAGSSFAGQLDSFISGNTAKEVMDYLYKCWGSIHKENVVSYEQQQGRKLKGMAVVVQELIDPDYAGVVFTRSHLQQDCMLVEYVQGHGEKLVSGEVNPSGFHISPDGKITGEQPPFDFSEAWLTCAELEKFYGYPLDIEWAIKSGRFYLVQSRPVTTAAKGPKIYWSNTNVNENYPEPITPLLYSIARDSYYHYFKNLSRLFQIPEEKIRQLEPAYANVIGIFGCRMYYNMSSIHRIISVSPFSKSLGASFDHFVGYTAETSILPEKASLGGKLRFVKDLWKLNASLLKGVNNFEDRAIQYSRKAKNAISYEELKESFYGFIEIRMHSWYKASLADFFAMVCHGVLGRYCRFFYGKDAIGIHNRLVQSIPGLISGKPIVDTYRIKMAIRSIPEVYGYFKKEEAAQFYNRLQFSPDCREIYQMVKDYLENWGYRCSGELMLTTEDYTDNPVLYIELLQQYDKLPDVDPEKLMAEKYHERQQVISGFRKKIRARYGILFPFTLLHLFILQLLIRLASDGIAARERARLKQALLYSCFKKVIKKIGMEFQKRKLLKEPEHIFYLGYQEIGEYLSSSGMLPGKLPERTQERIKEFEERRQLIYPDDFFSFLGEYPLPSNIVSRTAASPNNNALSGLSACGGMVRGTARVLASVMEASRLNKGDILVTRQTDPGWVVVFPLISGLIVERGGMLSHGAIVSREFGIPAVVGVDGATSRIHDGDQLILNADTGEITLL